MSPRLMRGGTYDDNHGDLEIDENRLKAADPDGLYLFMLKDYPT